MTTAAGAADGRRRPGGWKATSMSPQPLVSHWEWRPDWTAERPHRWWYATFERDATVQHLALQAQEALHPDAPVDPIPLPWLHLSLAEVGYVGDVPTDTARQHARAAQQELAGIGPVTLTIGPVSTMPGAIVFDVQAPQLDDVHDRLMSTLGHTCAQLAVQRPFAPHISVAYVHRSCTTDDVFDRAATTSPHCLPDSTASTDISEITLVDVVRDLQHYRWTKAYEVDLH